VAGCRERAPEQQPRPAEPFDVDLDRDLSFVYADLGGALRDVRSAQSVPISSRRVVRVIDPTFARADQTDYDQVYVVDLSAPPGGRLIAKPMSRFEFERRALAALPAGQGSFVRAPSAEPERAAPHDRVIVYRTSWCAACKQLEQHLNERRVPFVAHDIEKDPIAAEEMAAKAVGAGAEASRVPVVDVRGRVLIGFDPQRVDALLGDRT
jgi:glutaredoxin